MEFPITLTAVTKYQVAHFDASRGGKKGLKSARDKSEGTCRGGEKGKSLLNEVTLSLLTGRGSEKEQKEMRSYMDGIQAKTVYAPILLVCT